MRALRFLPRRVRRFLSRQPLPDSWLEQLHDEEIKPQGENVRPKRKEIPFDRENYVPIHLKWKQHYESVLLILIVFASAIVVYLIMR